MNAPIWVTVAEAVILTSRSKTVIYDIMREGSVRTEESTAGMTVNLADLRALLAKRKRGRPRGVPNQK